MRRACLIILLFFQFGISLRATPRVQDRGDVGSAECRAVQRGAQDAVLDAAPPRHRGSSASRDRVSPRSVKALTAKRVKTAASMVVRSKKMGEISGSCASCIINQFAHRIPIEDQQRCGQDPPDDPGDDDPGERVPCPCWDSETLDFEPTLLDPGRTACVSAPGLDSIAGFRDETLDSFWQAFACAGSYCPDSPECKFVDATNAMSSGGFLAISDDEYKSCLGSLLDSTMRAVNCP